MCQENCTARRASCLDLSTQLHREEEGTLLTFVKKTTLPGVHSAKDSALCGQFLKKIR